MKYTRVKINSSCSIHIYKTNKFKNIYTQMIFKDKFNSKNLTTSCLLSQLLQEVSEKHSSIREMSAHRESLYNMSLSLYTATYGDIHVYELRSLIINSDYIDERVDLLEQQFAHINEVLYQPLVTNNVFDKDNFIISKRNLEQRLNSIVDNKNQYAFDRLKAKFGRDKVYGSRIEGYEEELEQIDETSIYSEYLELLKRPLDIYVVGDVDAATIEKLALKYLKFNDKNITKGNSYADKKDLGTIKENLDISQAVLIKTFRADLTDSYHAGLLFNSIFGNGTHSKLFKILREKHGLCYSVTSFLGVSSGLVFAMAGISFSDSDLAIKLIDEQIKAIVDLKITDEEFNMAKKALNSGILMTTDNPVGLVSFYLSRHLENKEETIEEYIAAINSLTKEAVAAVAKKFSKKAVFLLAPKE